MQQIEKELDVAIALACEELELTPSARAIGVLQKAKAATSEASRVNLLNTIKNKASRIDSNLSAFGIFTGTVGTMSTISPAVKSLEVPSSSPEGEVLKTIAGFTFALAPFLIGTFLGYIVDLEQKLNSLR